MMAIHHLLKEQRTVVGKRGRSNKYPKKYETDVKTDPQKLFGVIIDDY